MNVIKFEIDGLLAYQPNVFGDERGQFMETFNQKQFDELVGNKITFVQDNQSKSIAGVLRGLHFQAPPFAQGKLVSVIQGRALDVAVDIRKNSSTYGKHIVLELSDENKNHLWIPEGFAHGFISLMDNTIFSYKCTNFYNPSSEGCIKWNDDTLNINWGLSNPILSSKDEKGISFASFNSPF